MRNPSLALLAAALVLLAPAVAATPPEGPGPLPRAVSVSIETPLNGSSVGGDILISGNTSGFTGQGFKVEVSIDGFGPYPAQGNGSWSFLWSTFVVANGPRIITVVASDTSGRAEAQLLVLVDNAQPGSLSFVSRSPPEQELAMRAGTGLNFSVTLSGPMGNASIEWLVDNATVPAPTDPGRFAYLPRNNGTWYHTVMANLMQGGKLLDSARWNLTVLPEETPPELLSRYPGEANLTLQQGDALNFSVDLMDPAGLPLNYTWYLDGEVLYSGENLSNVSVSFGQSGLHCVTASVTNGMAAVNVSWNVSVEAVRAATLLDFAPCIVYIIIGMLLGVFYGLRAARAQRPRPVPPAAPPAY